MTTLDQLQEDYKAGVIGAQHVMIVGQTKMGKTHWVAEVAKAGFEVLYLDRDNGLGTLMAALKDHPEAMKRIHYFAPKDLATFFENIYEMGVYRYNITQEKSFSSGTAKDDDEIVEFRGAKFPRNLVLALDSWTSISDDVIRVQAEKRKVNLAEVDRYSREIYGGVGFRLTRIATFIQHAPYHVIAQAHPDVYEIREKPTGVVRSIDERDMIIKDTIDIPMSGSRPHGYTLGKFFNQIGWLEIDGFGKRILDFTVKPKRIGGGTITTKGDVGTTHSFAKLFFPEGVPPIEEHEGIVYMTAGEFKEKQGSSASTPETVPSSPPSGASKPKAGLSLGGIKRG